MIISNCYPFQSCGILHFLYWKYYRSLPSSSHASICSADSYYAPTPKYPKVALSSRLVYLLPSSILSSTSRRKTCYQRSSSQTICIFYRAQRSFASILRSPLLVHYDSSSSNFLFLVLDCRFILADSSRQSFAFQSTAAYRQVLGIYPSNFCCLPWLFEAALHINSPSIS